MSRCKTLFRLRGLLKKNLYKRRHRWLLQGFHSIMDPHGPIYDYTVNGMGKTPQIVRDVGYLMSVLN